MTDVYLYGALGRKFTHRISMDVSSPGEAIRALSANFPEFQQYLVTHSVPGYRIIIGQSPIPGPEGLMYPSGRAAIKIIPVITGAAKSPFIGVILGAVLIAASIATLQVYGLAPGGALIATGGGLTFAGHAAVTAGLIGASLAIGGVSQLLAGSPRSPDVSELPQNKPSHIFNGPVNTTAQGHPVPIGYGRLRVGSAVISAAISTVDIPV